MANKPKRRFGFNPFQSGNAKMINSYIANINAGMKKLYQDTYISDRTKLDDMERITGDIENSISRIINRNSSTDYTGITKLYAKLALKQATNDTDLHKKIEEMFNNSEFNNNLLGSYMSNKWIYDVDREIDTVLTYCTKMGEALDLLLDAVISADSVNKDTLLFNLDSTDDSEISIFNDRIIQINKKYDIDSKLRLWAEKASKYGECWLYVAPYNKAIQRMLDNLDNKRDRHPNSSSGFEFGKNGVLKEMVIMENGTVNGNFTSTNAPVTIQENSTKGFSVIIDTSRVLRSALDNLSRCNESLEESYSVLEEAFDYVNESGKAKNKTSEKKEKMQVTIPNELELPKDFDAADGLIDTSLKSKSKSRGTVKTKGCVVEMLKRENVIPLDIQDTFMGCYYVEFTSKSGHDFYNTMLDKYGKGYDAQPTSTITKGVNDGMLTANTDSILKNIAKKIASELDANFVNSNQDITKEIYSILKYNDILNSSKSTEDGNGIDSMKISFLPAEDVHVLKFREDEDTHRGISDCAKGLIPAKLFSCLYVTNSTGIMTRGQDKRVYYVKQTIDTNIAQTLMNVINQIKMSNFNIRQIENMNNVLNITGRFNDHFIPVGPSGESPVQFEVMQGQQFEINTDLYNMLEEMAVNSIGIPIELVQSRNSPDFATQFTSSSIKVLRMVFGRQNAVEKFINPIINKIYRYEYPDEINNRTISCELPPPIFLSMVNTTQLIQNTKTYIQEIADLEFNGDQSPTADIERAIFERKMLKAALASYIKTGDIERTRRAAKFEAQKITNAEAS